MVGAYPRRSGFKAGASPGQVSPSNQDNVDMLIHLICMLLGYGRKLKYPEKTYADMGKMCIFHIAVALAEN